MVKGGKTSNKKSNGSKSSTSQDPNLGPAFRFTFLQAIMNSGCMKEADAKQLFGDIAGEITDDRYLGFVAAVNHHIQFAGFSIRTVLYPGENGSGERYVGFVNTQADEESKVAIKFRSRDGKPDIRIPAYYKGLIELIAESNSTHPMGHITVHEALQMPLPQLEDVDAPRIPNIGIKEREEALNVLVHDGWLSTSQGSGYCLGPRALLELGQYVLSHNLPASRRFAIDNAL